LREGSRGRAEDPIGGFALDVRLGGQHPLFAGLRRLVITGPSPMAELRKHFPEATILFDPGESPADAAAIARRADVAVVMGIKIESENHDNAT
jgi:beta-glucosidase